MLYNKVNNTFMNRQLFLETSDLAKREEYPPVWTLKRHEYKGLPSAYVTFMSCVDEYAGAIALCGSMKNWRILNQGKWFKEGSAEYGHEGSDVWLNDMKKRDASFALEILNEEAKLGNVTAAKALLAEAQKGIKKVTPKKGVSQVENELANKVAQFNRKSR